MPAPKNSARCGRSGAMEMSGRAGMVITGKVCVP
jgi:hypothetical protein